MRKAKTIRILTILLLAGVMLLAGCSRSAPVLAATAAKSSPDQSTSTASTIEEDHEKLQGTWKMDRSIFNGQTLIDDVRWIFDGDHMTIVLHGYYEGGLRTEYQLGTGDAPNTILIKTFNNPLADKGYTGGSFTGIYKLSGDKLRVCYDMTGLKYPNNFDAGRGTNRMTYEFTREKTEQHAAGQ
jgi:uncharacterized protein (TIGR03067 family)